MDINDADYIVEEIWRARSALSRSPEHLTLVRWNRQEPTTLWNVVVMTKKEADAHDKITSVREAYPLEVVDRIERRLQEVRKLEEHLQKLGFA